MLDNLNRAYDRIAAKFPAEWPVTILANGRVGRSKLALDDHRTRPVEDLDYSLHVTAGGVDYCEIDVDLDDIERAAQAIIDKIAAADMADPVKSRRGLDRLAAALETAGGGAGRAA